MEEQRTLPHSLEAERAVLGGLMLDSASAGDMAELLEAEDFYREAHGKLYTLLLEMAEKGNPTEMTAVVEKVIATHREEELGGLSYIISLPDKVPSTENIAYYAGIVRERAIVRRLLVGLTEVAERARAGTDELPELLDFAESTIFKVTQEKSSSDWQVISKVVDQEFMRIQQLSERSGEVTGISTGFIDLDKKLAGLQRTDLIILAARPAMGKCLSADSRIVQADGSLLRIDEMVRRGHGSLLTLDDHMQLSVTQPSAFIDDGTKPVFEVRTRLGRRVRTTLTHPFLTTDGWKPLSSLHPGVRIAVPRRIPIFGRQHIGEARAHQLAEQLWAQLQQPHPTSGTSPAGLGYTTPSHPTRILDPLARLSATMSTGRPALDVGPPPPAVPPVVFTAPREDVACFLRGLLSKTRHRSEEGVRFRLRNEEVARAVQHLLLRFGVIAARQDEHELVLLDGQSMGEGISELGLSDEIGSASSVEGAARDVYWDEIEQISYLGMLPVFDLTVPETHNFVAEDVCVHNTALALNLCLNAAKTGAGVGMFSLEMSCGQLVTRLLCAEGRVDAGKVRTGFLSREHDWPNLNRAAESLYQMPIYIDDTPGLNITQLRSKARRLKSICPDLGVLIIDYIGLMSGDGRVSRQEQIAQSSRGMKALAKELDICVLCLSQLNRAVEQRNPKIPQIADLRESGAIEQDADIIMFIYREDYYNKESPRQGEADVIIAKQRNGPTGTVTLHFEGKHTRFDNLAKNYSDDGYV